MAFRFERGGVQMDFGTWRGKVADHMDALGDCPRATRVRACGSYISVRVCRDCKAKDWAGARASANCESRVCPSCARTHAIDRRAYLEDVIGCLPWRGWFWHTISVPYDPELGTSIDAIEGRFEAAWKAWGLAWEYLSSECGARCAIVVAEVADGGLVHLHVLAWHPWIAPAKLAELRGIVLGALPLGADGKAARWYKLGRLYSKGKNRPASKPAAEIAKYLCKGVASNDRNASQTHPLLAAMTDIALRDRKTWREYGDVPLPPVRPWEPWECPCCASRSHVTAYLPETTARALRSRESALAQPLGHFQRWHLATYGTVPMTSAELERFDRANVSGAPWGAVSESA
jgi:hypothetical protein